MDLLRSKLWSKVYCNCTRRNPQQCPIFLLHHSTYHHHLVGAVVVFILSSTTFIHHFIAASGLHCRSSIHVNSSITFVFDFLCLLLPVSLAFCVFCFRCLWLPVSSASCVFGFLCLRFPVSLTCCVSCVFDRLLGYVGLLTSFLLLL